MLKKSQLRKKYLDLQHAVIYIDFMKYLFIYFWLKMLFAFNKISFSVLSLSGVNNCCCKINVFSVRIEVKQNPPTDEE